MPNIYLLLRDRARGIRNSRAIEHWVEDKIGDNLHHATANVKDMHLGEHAFEHMAHSEDLLATYSDISHELTAYNTSNPSHQKLWSVTIENPVNVLCGKLIVSAEGYILYVTHTDRSIYNLQPKNVFVHDIQVYYKNRHLGNITLDKSSIILDSVRIVGTRIYAFSNAPHKKYGSGLFEWDIANNLTRKRISAHEINHSGKGWNPGCDDIYCNENYYIVTHRKSIEGRSGTIPVFIYSFANNKKTIFQIDLALTNHSHYKITEYLLSGHQLIYNVEFSNPKSLETVDALYTTNLLTRQTTAHHFHSEMHVQIKRTIACINDFVVFYTNNDLRAYDLQNDKVSHIESNSANSIHYSLISSSVIGNTLVISNPKNSAILKIVSFDRKMQSSPVQVTTYSMPVNVILDEGKVFASISFIRSKLFIFYKHTANTENAFSLHSEDDHNNENFGVKIHDYLLSPDEPVEDEEKIEEEKFIPNTFNNHRISAMPSFLDELTAHEEKDNDPGESADSDYEPPRNRPRRQY